MVSMKDIAKRCGVSIATVSKSLNGYSDIGAEKREEIKKAAEEMGYFPNSSARALKTKRTYNLGVLFADKARSGLTHDYFGSILESFKVAAEAKGYDITFTNCNLSNRRMSYYEHCRYRGVDGLVIACIDFDTPEVQELIRSSLPLVTIDHVFDGRIAVVSDNVGGMKELVSYVYRMGHRKIAYIHGMDSSVTRGRLSSFHRTMGEYGIDTPDEYVREAAYRDTGMTEIITKELLTLDNPPTCILYPDDFSALGGINAIRSMGMKIPDDISIAGYDGITISRVLEPKLTTIHQDTQSIGRKAAQELINLIEEPKITLIEKIVVEGELLTGNSVKNLNNDE
ncbi:MAG: LacI family DNA-binding transcriptional regulator [Lachnospiraceae bacterium]|nr:LacI family DNA-binding transcriptional regulator [Lachnospiraceae bacterium]